MPSDLALVTDSTAYLSQEALDRHGITVVPLSVAVGDSVLSEGVEISPKDVAEALRGKQRVTTSRPNPETFAAAYRAAAEAGAEGIVSVHISGELSGTVEAARLAAAEAPVPVRVVDSRLVGMALGYAVLAAAESIAAGRGLAEAAEAASRRGAVTSGFFYVDTLEHLRRGGRIGAAQALLGSALAVKPLLHLDGGRIEPLEKVRTSSRAIARLEEIAVERSGEGEVDIAVHHLAAEERAEPL
ncbi:DegV family protein, partial [Streptomyces sp. FH025]|uniref:DegV family protein n=1 Tax=Streptomyces sp. FH025 TaxID=2815937 RepID=UPI001A9E4AF7